MDLKADLAFGEVGGELVGGGDFDSVDPDGAGLAPYQDLHVEPFAFGVGGDL